MSDVTLTHISTEMVRWLDDRFGGDWHFDVHLYNVGGGELAVEGELKANGRKVTHRIVMGDDPALAVLSIGDRIETATVRSLEACVVGYDSGPSALVYTPTTLKKVTIDPIKARLIGGAFNTIAQEMAQTLYRMSCSSIVRESEDLSCGLFDAEGRQICESESSPRHMGSLPSYIRNFMSQLGGQVYEGDIIIHNHPYFGASHTQDMGVALPIFCEGDLLGFSASTAHLVDVGGATPGANVDLIDIYAEGMLFHSVKLYERGRRNEEVWSLLQNSVRTPELNVADIEAMIAAVHLGRERFLALITKYSAQTVMGTAYHWMDYSERRLRAEIKSISDGDYHAESWLDNDGRNREVPLKVNVTVKVRGSDVVIDLAGSADEVETAYNVPFEGSLQVGCFYAIRTLMLDDAVSGEFISQNDGMFRPISAIAPKGSIFNPNFPRACRSGMAQIQQVIDCVIRALAPVVPDRVTAGNAASGMTLSYWGFHAERQQYWVCVEINDGSYGGRATKDGLDTVDTLLTNTRNVPIEEVEMRYPVRVERYQMRDEPPGAGRWRGGIGATREVRFLVDGFISASGDRNLEAPLGIFGGRDGSPSKLTKNSGQADEEAWPSNATGLRLKAGDSLRYEGGIGGGYGDPMERDPYAVLNDWLDDHITTEIAAHTYGVIIGCDGAIDIEATEEARTAYSTRRQRVIDDPASLSVTAAAHAIAARHLTSEALVESLLARISMREAEVGAWAWLDVEQVREQARQRDRQAPVGPLHGVPIGIKDVIDTADMPTEYNSTIYQGHRPTADADCVARLKAAGAIIMGKTVTTEFAFQHPGKTTNPHNPVHTPGGSSSGSAAAVADRMVPAALGTQTSGSVIRPSAFCGVIGYKPTFGMISTRGLKYLSPGLDTIGFMVRSLDDVALLMGVLTDTKTAAVSSDTVPRLAVCRTGHWDEAEAAMQQLFNDVVDAASQVCREVELPADFVSLDALQRAVLSADMALSLAREVAEAPDQLSHSIRDFIESSDTVAPNEIHEKWQLARARREQMGMFFDADEIILTLSAPGEAPPGLQSTGNALFNRVWTMMHVPCLQLPVREGPQGLPLGVQLISPNGDEGRLLAAARWLAKRLVLPVFD